MPKKALFVINTMTYFTGLIDLALLLKNDPKSNYRSFFYFPAHYPTIGDDLIVCDRNNIKYTLDYRAPQKPSFGRRLMDLLVNSNFFSAFFREITGFYRQFGNARQILQRIKPDIIILAGDNVGYNTEAMIKVGHKNKIPSIIVPLWMADAKEAAEAYYLRSNHSVKRPFNFLVSLIFPDWAYLHKGNKILRWSADKILAMKLFGIDPPKPWALNSGAADVLLAQSQSMRQYMVKSGLPKEKIELTGSIANDILFKSINATKLTKQKKPILLCALPPDMISGSSRTGCEFSSYDKLVAFWMSAIADIRGYTVIVSLHPSIVYEQISYIERRWNVKIMQEPIIKLIPFCDIFVASISATIQWAIASGKPVINYDVYQYGYNDYKNVPGVVTINSKQDFLETLHRVTSDKKYFSNLVTQQQAVSASWGMLDGLSGARVLNLINQIIATNN